MLDTILTRETVAARSLLDAILTPPYSLAPVHQRLQRPAAPAQQQPSIRSRAAARGVLDAPERKAWAFAEVDEPGLLFGTRKRVIASCQIREAMLTDKGVTSATSEQMSMRAYMSSLAVQESWRRRPVRINGARCSLAVELMRECERVARDEWGYDETYLNVYEANDRAAKLYVDKLGYEVVSTREHAAPRRGAPSVSICMRKQLRSSDEPDESPVAAARAAAEGPARC